MKGPREGNVQFGSNKTDQMGQWKGSGYIQRPSRQGQRFLQEVLKFIF